MTAGEKRRQMQLKSIESSLKQLLHAGGKYLVCAGAYAEAAQRWMSIGNENVCIKIETPAKL